MLERLHAGVRIGGLFSTSSSASGLVANFPALGLDDLTFWPAQLCAVIFLIFAILFCRHSGSLSNSKNAFQIVPTGNVHDDHVFGLLVLAATTFMVLVPLEAVTAPWSVQPSRCVDDDTTQVGRGKGLTVCLCKRERIAGSFPTAHFRWCTNTTAHQWEGKQQYFSVGETVLKK